MIKLLHIVEAAKACTGFGINKLRSRDRWSEAVRIRHACIILARKHTHHSTTVIGRYFDRDHTTVLYVLGRDKGNDYKMHPDTQEYIEQIEAAMLEWAETGQLSYMRPQPSHVYSITPPVMQKEAANAG